MLNQFIYDIEDIYSNEEMTVDVTVVPKNVLQESFTTKAIVQENPQRTKQGIYKNENRIMPDYEKEALIIATEYPEPEKGDKVTLGTREYILADFILEDPGLLRIYLKSKIRPAMR